MLPHIDNYNVYIYEIEMNFHILIIIMYIYIYEIEMNDTLLSEYIFLPAFYLREDVLART
jgi:hypothetical protein